MTTLLSIAVAMSTPVGEVMKYDEYRGLRNAVLVGSNIVATATDSLIVAIKPDGSVAWKLDVKSVVPTGGLVTRLVATDKQIYFMARAGQADAAVGLIKPDGTVAWHKKISGKAASKTAAVSPKGDLVAALGNPAILSRFSPQGVERWSRPLGKAFAAEILADDDATYVATNRLVTTLNGLQVTKIDGHGMVSWTKDGGYQANSLKAPLRNGRWLYDSQGIIDTMIHCMDMRTGTVLWTRQLPGDGMSITAGTMNNSGDALAATTVSGGQVKLWCVDKSGLPVWTKGWDKLEGIRALHLNNDRSGYFYGQGDTDSDRGKLARFDKDGGQVWAQGAPYQGGNVFMRRLGRVELYGISEIVSSGARARAWFIEK